MPFIYTLQVNAATPALRFDTPEAAYAAREEAIVRHAAAFPVQDRHRGQAGNTLEGWRAYFEKNCQTLLVLSFSIA